MIKIPLKMPDKFDDPIKYIEYLHKLIWLSSREIVFWGCYNEVEDKHDENAYPFLGCNDTFYYASADGENFEEKDMDLIIEVYKKFSWSGVDAWIALKRGIDVLEQRITPEYLKAKEWIKNESGQGN